MRRFLISAANIGPNRFHQNRTVSWQMSMPRSNSRSSTWRSDSGNRAYIITVRRITSGELLKAKRICHPPKLRTALVRLKLIRSEEHTSELQSLMRISYAVFCLKKKKQTQLKLRTRQPPLQQ